MPHRAVMTSRNYPFETMLFVAAAAAGISFFRHEPPPLLQQFMPRWFLVYWYLAVLLGGLCGITSVLLPRRTVKQTWVVLNVEAGALFILIGVLFSYSTAILYVAHGKGITSVLLTSGWMVASLVRAVQVLRSVRLMSEAGNPRVETR